MYGTGRGGLYATNKRRTVNRRCHLIWRIIVGALLLRHAANNGFEAIPVLPHLIGGITNA